MAVQTRYIIIGTVSASILIALIVGLSVGLTRNNGGNEKQNTDGPPPQPTEPSTGDPQYKSEYREYRFAAVATDTVPCSQIGTEVLGRMGGSAVDAAIAAMLCVGVVNAHSSGIGGGHFMTIYDTPRGETEKVFTTILAREHAPLASFQDMFVNDTDAAQKGGLAIATPGEIAGFKKAHDMFGRVPWADLFTPTIKLCEEGFTVERNLASAIRQYENAIRDDPNLGEIFLKENGELIQEGDTLINEKLGATFRIIADDPDAFYNPTSQLAQDIVADIAEYDGIITVEDLAAYEAKVKDALNVTLDNGDFTVFGPRPPSSGVVFQYILNILDGYDFHRGDIEGDDDKKVLSYHRIVEAFKFAYAKRSDLGDEDYWDVVDLLRNLTSDVYAEATRLKISDDQTHNVSYYEPSFDGFEDSGTAHASIFAQDGSAVGITATINLFFGSNVRGKRTGILFNDEMDDFSIPGTFNSFGVPASPSNYIKPQKMPMSSMCPALIVDKEGVVRYITGASGGTRITTASAYLAIHSLWFNMNLEEVTETPRIHHQLVPNVLRYETSFDRDLLAGLEAKGHETQSYGSIAVAQTIHNTCTDDDRLNVQCVHAVTDAGRKNGIPDGF